MIVSYIVVVGVSLSRYKSTLVISAIISVIRVIDDEYEFSFWYIEVLPYYVYCLVLLVSLIT